MKVKKLVIEITLDQKIYKKIYEILTMINLKIKAIICSNIKIILIKK